VEDARKLPLLLGGMFNARRTLHTLGLKFIGQTANPYLPLALAHFTALTYGHIGAREL
jgi:hypothetical protein